MNTNTTSKEQKFRLTPEERSSWDENGYFVRYDVFTETENDMLRQIADDIAVDVSDVQTSHIISVQMQNEFLIRM